MTGIDTFDRSCPIDFFNISQSGIFSLGSLKCGNCVLLYFATKISEFKKQLVFLLLLSCLFLEEACRLINEIMEFSLDYWTSLIDDRECYFFMSTMLCIVLFSCGTRSISFKDPFFKSFPINPCYCGGKSSRSGSNNTSSISYFLLVLSFLKLMKFYSV